MLSATIQRRMISSKIPSLFCPMLSNVDATTALQCVSTAHRASISISSGRRIAQSSQYSSLATNNNMDIASSRNELSHCIRFQSIKHANITIRTNFSYAGPRKLSDILKVELLKDKSAAEIVSILLLL